MLVILFTSQNDVRVLSYRWHFERRRYSSPYYPLWLYRVHNVHWYSDMQYLIMANHYFSKSNYILRRLGQLPTRFYWFSSHIGFYKMATSLKKVRSQHGLHSESHTVPYSVWLWIVVFRSYLIMFMLVADTIFKIWRPIGLSKIATGVKIVLAYTALNAI